MLRFARNDVCSNIKGAIFNYNSYYSVGIWRFELCEYVPRSAEPKGTRLYIWPDIDLADAKVNYGLWQDYLRCYKFDLNLDIDLAVDKTYILQAVCFTTQGTRITDSVELKL